MAENAGGKTPIDYARELRDVKVRDAVLQALGAQDLAPRAPHAAGAGPAGPRVGQ